MFYFILKIVKNDILYFFINKELWLIQFCEHFLIYLME